MKCINGSYDVNESNITLCLILREHVNGLTMSSVSHLKEAKKDLAREVHRLGRLGVRLESDPNEGALVHHNSE